MKPKERMKQRRGAVKKGGGSRVERAKEKRREERKPGGGVVYDCLMKKARGREAKQVSEELSECGHGKARRARVGGGGGGAHRDLCSLSTRGKEMRTGKKGKKKKRSMGGA